MPIANFAVPFSGLDPWDARPLHVCHTLRRPVRAEIAGWQPASSCFTQTPTPQDAPPQDSRRYCDGSSYYASIGPTGVR